MTQTQLVSKLPDQLMTTTAISWKLKFTWFYFIKREGKKPAHLSCFCYFQTVVEWQHQTVASGVIFIPSNLFWNPGVEENNCARKATHTHSGLVHNSDWLEQVATLPTLVYRTELAGVFFSLSFSLSFSFTFCKAPRRCAHHPRLLETQWQHLLLVCATFSVLKWFYFSPPTHFNFNNFPLFAKVRLRANGGADTSEGFVVVLVELTQHFLSLSFFSPSRNWKWNFESQQKSLKKKNCLQNSVFTEQL